MKVTCIQIRLKAAYIVLTHVSIDRTDIPTVACNETRRTS